LGELEVRVREAAHVLKDALLACERGHRGWKIDPLPVVNEVLDIFDTPYRLVKQTNLERS
jgi:hypothetical protein